MNFRKQLSKDIFKHITTRDDLNELSKYIRNTHTRIGKVADPGILAAEVYNVKRDVDSDTIGIGIINYQRFKEFHRGISKREYIETICEIVAQLDEKNQKWKMFTNGENADAMCAYEIAEKLGVDPNKNVLVPNSPQKLVENISGFKAIITSRLHSCIVAYSLDVPFVAISWNNKLSYFAENIGSPERIFEKDRLNSNEIIEGVEAAIVKGYDKSIKSQLRETIFTTFRQYLNLLEAKE